MLDHREHPGTTPDQAGNPMAIAGFVLSLCAVALFWVPFPNFIAWILGVIFSAIGLKRANRGAPHRGLAIAGLVISLGAAVLILLFIAGIGFLIVSL